MSSGATATTSTTAPNNEALDYVQKADKKGGGGGGGGFSAFFGGGSSSRLEEAGELYVRAGNSYRMSRHWKESGDAFVKAGDVAIRMGEKDDASNHFVNASKSYKKTHPEAAIQSLQRAIQILTEKGRLRTAADRERDIAQIYQQDLSDNLRAMEAFERAGEWYSAEDAPAMANGCFKESAALAATLDQFDKAIERFEQVARASIDNPLTKWSTKDYFLKAGLCHIAKADSQAARRAIEGYSELDTTFQSSRESDFLLKIVDAVDAGDQEAFTQHVIEYDRLSKLDNWKTAILLRIKRSINEEPDLT